MVHRRSSGSPASDKSDGRPVFMRAELRAGPEPCYWREEPGCAGVRARYEQGSAEEKKMLSLAISNLAIGVARNLVLAKQAPDAVKSIGGNPALLQRVGQLKLAGELVGMQAKGLSGIATKLPALLSAVKVKAPSAPETTDPLPLNI